MGTKEQRAFEGIYKGAQRDEDLPWHRATAETLLAQAEKARGGTGRALDIGCGTGAHAVFLARRGWQVTGLDFAAAPLATAQAKARTAQVDLQLVHGDVLNHEFSDRFDLVLDSGCLHGLPPAERDRYKQQLLRFLAPDGDYVLLHLLRRHAIDWWPFGPRRPGRADIVAQLTPELAEHSYSEDLQAAPLLIRPLVKLGKFWFRRTV